MKIIYALAFCAMFTSSAFASHFRGGSVDYQLGSDQILTVTVYAAWRSTFLGGVNMRIYADNDTNRNTSLLNMTQQSLTVTQVDNEYPGGEQFTVRKHVFTADLSGLAPGFYIARWESNARVAGVVNVGETRWSLETRVDFRSPGTANGSPTMIPATVDMVGIGLDWTQNLSAVDPEGGPLSYQFILGANDPDWGMNFQIPGLVIDSNGQLLIPAANTATMLNERRYSYKVRVTDSSGSYAERDVLMVARNLEPGDMPPVLNPIGDQFVASGNDLILNISATDGNASDNLTLRLVAGPTVATMTTTQGLSTVGSTFSWISAQPQGIYTASIEVFDKKPSEGTTLIDSELFTITVTGDNQFPILDPIGNRNISVGGTLTFTLSASDTETVTGNLIYTASFLPAGATFNTSTRQFSWTPTAGQLGNWSGIVFRVTDDDPVVPLYDQEAITISVGPNQSPVFVPVADQVMALGTSFNQNFSATDAGGDTVTLTLQSFPAGAGFSSISGSTATGNILWTPTAAGTYTFTVRATDNNANPLTQNLSFNVTVVDNVPPNLSVLTDFINGVFITDTTPKLKFTISDNNAQTLTYQLQVSTDPTFATTLVDYTDSATTGTVNFTIGKNPGSGTYTQGSAGQTLGHGGYYWRVNVTDPFGLSSGYTTTGNSTLAFAINDLPATPTIISPQSGEMFAGSPTFTFNLSDPDGDNVGYNIEISKDSTFATGVTSFTEPASATTSISTTRGPFTSGGYFWRVKAIDALGGQSAFVNATSNANPNANPNAFNGAVAFTVDQAPSTPTNLNVAVLSQGNVSLSTNPTLSFNVTDPDVADTLSYHVQVLSSGSNVIDYISALGAQGARSFTIGQAASGGLYTVGSGGQSLTDGIYDWRVRSLDLYGLASNWISGNTWVKNTAPNMSYLYPLSSGNHFFRPTENAVFQFNLSDSESMYYELYIKNSANVVVLTSSANNVTSGNVSLSLAPITTVGNYTWSVNVTDSYGSSTNLVSADAGFVVNAAPGVPDFPLTLTEIFVPGLTGKVYSSTEHPPKTNTSRPSMGFTFSDGDSSNAKLQVQISSDSTFASTQVDYLSASTPLTPNLPALYFDTGILFTVGQAAGTGVYTTGTFNQVLPSGIYHVRARAYDEYGPGSWMNSKTILVDQAPLAATGLSPQNEANVNSLTPTLYFTLDDPEDDLVRYVLTVKDHLGATLIEYISGWVSEGPQSFTVGTSANSFAGSVYGATGFQDPAAYYKTGSTSLSLPRIVTSNEGYDWSVLAYDAWEQTSATTNAAATTHAFNTNLDPYAPSSLSPESGQTTSNTKPTFSFTLSDPNPGQQVKYQLEYSTSPTYATSTVVTSALISQGAATYTPTVDLAKGSYYWRVLTTDSASVSGNYSLAAGGGVAFIVNQKPLDPTPIYPISDVGYDLSKTTPSLQFTVADADGDNVGYRVQISPQSDFSIIEVDYRSAIPSTNGFFTVGQAVETGTINGQYVIGTAGQSLQSSSLYYWRVQAIDALGDVNNSGFISANSTVGAVHFRTTLPPAATLTSPTGNVRVNPGSVPFHFSISDPESHQVNYVLNVGSYATGSIVATATNTSLVTPGSLQSNLNLSTQGYYTWTVQGTDAYGAIGTSANSDSISTVAFRVNQLPLAPVLQTVGSSNVTSDGSPSLTAFLSDPDGDVMTYQLDIDDSSDFSSPLLTYSETQTVTSGTNATWNWKTSPNGSFSVGSNALVLPSGFYVWRMKATDTFSDNSTYASGNFRVNQAPAAPTLTGPINGLALNSSQPTFTFAGSDPEVDAIRYQISISANGQMATPLVTYQSNLRVGNSFSYTLGQLDVDGQYLVGSTATVLGHGSYDWQVALLDFYGFAGANTTSTGNYAFAVNAPPSSPVIVSPQNASLQRTFQPTFTFSASDPDADPLTYTLVVDDDSNLSSPLLSYSGTVVAGTTTYTYGQVAGTGTYNVGAVGDALSLGSYYWSVQTKDSYGNTSSVVSASTTVGGNAFWINQLPTVPVITSPANGLAVTTRTPTLNFTLSDPEGDSMTARVDVSTDPTFATLTFSAQMTGLSTGAASFQVGQAGTYLQGSALPLNQGSYYWRVTAFDSHDLTSGVTTTANGGAIAFTVDTAPASTLIAEVTPLGVVQSTTANETVWVQFQSDLLSTGFDRVNVTLPATFVASSSPITAVKLNGVSVSFSSLLVGNVAQLTLNNAVTGNGRLELTLPLTYPNTPSSSETFGIFAFHSTFNENLTASAGDANGLGDGGQLSLQVSPLGPVLSAFSEVQPTAITQATQLDLTLTTHAVMDSQTSGVQHLQMVFPSDLTILSLGNVTVGGVLTAVTSSISGQTLTITLPSLLTTTTSMVTVVKVRAPLAPSVQNIQGVIYNSTDTVQSSLVAGDGDLMGNGGSLTLTTTPAGPALSAFGEVNPRAVTKGTSGENLHLWVNVTQDPTTSGVDQMTFATPSELTGTSITSLKFAGTSLSHTATSSGNVWTLQWPTKVHLSGVFEVQMKVNTASTIGASPLNAVTVNDTSYSSPLSVLTGDGDDDGLSGTLYVSRLAKGPAAFVSAEVQPKHLIINSTELIEVKSQVTILPSDTGFDIYHFALPETIIGANVLNAQWNGLSIAHTSSRHAHHGSSIGLYVKINDTITSSGFLSILVEVNTSGIIDVEPLVDLKLAKVPAGATDMTTTLSGITFASEGDGDGDGVVGDWDLITQADGPASRIVVEALPNQLTKGVEQTFRLFAYPSLDARHLGITGLSWEWPSALSSLQLVDLRVDGSSEPILASTVSSTNLALTFSKISRPQVIQLTLKAMTSAQVQTLDLMAPKFGFITPTTPTEMYTSANVMTSFSVDGDQLSDGGTLNVDLIPAGPALTVLAELHPNQAIKSSRKRFEYDVQVQIDPSSSGVDLLTLTLPTGYTQATLISMQNNGGSVAFTDLSSTSGTQPRLRAQLAQKVTSDSILTMIFEVDLPSVESQDNLAFAEVDDSSYTFPRAVVEGDGDGQNNGGSLALKVVSKATVLSALSEVKPNRVTKNSAVTLTFHHYVVMDTQTSGFDTIRLPWPANYTSASVTTVEMDGSGLNFSSNFSSGAFTLTLDRVINRTGILTVKVSAMSPTYEATEQFPPAYFIHSTQNLTDQGLEGDGDQQDDGGSLSLETQAVGPALEVVAEVSPNRMSLGAGRVNFDLDIKIVKDVTTSDLTKLELTMPPGYTNPLHRQILVDGASVDAVVSISTNVITWSLNTAITSSSLVRLLYSAEIPLVESTEPLSKLRVLDATQRSVYAKEGTTGAQFDRPSSWTLATRAVGAGRDAVAEVSPSRVVVNELTRMTLHSTVIHDQTSLPVKRWLVNMPSTFTEVAVQTVQIEGSSVAFTSSLIGQQIEVLLTTPMSATGRLDLVFDAKPTVTGSEKLSASVWNRWQEPIASDNLFTFVREGDGDNGAGLGKNRLIFEVVSSADALWAESEVRPNTVATSELTTFSQSVQVHGRSDMSGIQKLSLFLPKDYSNLSFQSLKWQGASIQVLNTSTSTQLNLSLVTPLIGSGVFSIDYQATSRSTVGQDAFSQGSLTLLDGSSLFWVEGDGDDRGEQGLNSWTVSALSNPPLSSAIAEITPHQAVLNEPTSFEFLLKLNNSTNRYGVDAMVFEWPASYTVGSVTSLKVDGQSLTFTSNLTGRVMTITPSTVIKTSSLVSLSMSAIPLFGYGIDQLKAPILMGNGQSLTANIGDADGSSSTPQNDLSVQQIQAGPVESMRSEITPLQVKTSRNQDFHVHAFIRIGKSPKFTGFDTLEMNVPATYGSLLLTSVKVDGSSVNFSNLSQGQVIKAQLTQGLWSDALIAKEHVLTLSFSALTPSIELTESFSQLSVYSSLAPSAQTKTTEGDGDLGIMSSFGDRYQVSSVNSIPVSKFEVEIFPNQMRVSQTRQSLDVYAHLDFNLGDSGVSIIELNLPESLALRTKVLKVNNAIVGEDLSSGNLIRYRFSPAIRFDSVIQLSMTLDSGTSVLVDQFSRFRCYSEAGASVTASEGDGDGSQFSIRSNSWSISLLASSLASRVESRILPKTINTNQQQTFRYFAEVNFKGGDLGFDQINLGVPSEITQVALDGVYILNNGRLLDVSTGLPAANKVPTTSAQLNGVALAKTSSELSSGSGLRIQLPQVYSSNLLLEVRFTGVVNNETKTPMEFSQFELRNSLNPALAQKSLSSSVLDWQTNAVIARPVLDATAEISPAQVVVSSASNTTRQIFSYYIKTEESLATGFNRIKVSIPVTFKNLSFVQLWSYSSTTASRQILTMSTAPVIVGETMTLNLDTSLTKSWLELQFAVDAPLNPGLERFALIELSDAVAGQAVQVIAGETGLLNTTRNDPLLVEILPSGVVQTISAEITPNTLRTPALRQNFSYQVFLDFNALSTGVDYLQLTLPNEFLNPQFLGVTVDGAQVLFEDQSSYPVSDSGRVGGTLAIRLPRALNTDARVELFFRSDFRPYQTTVNVSDFWVSRYPLEENTPVVASEGNGGSGVNDQWSVQLQGPSAGFRPVSDYPLLISNSGDFAEPVIIGYGFAGGGVAVSNAANVTLTTGKVDALGFFALRLPMFSAGNHLLQTSIIDAQGDALGGGLGNRSHLVAEVSTLMLGDTDKDGMDDYDDADDDNDGILDIYDRYPTDFDNDGIVNAPIVLDPTDSDGDGIVDAIDPMPNEHQSITDTDNDGTPDLYDLDDDNDGLADSYDALPYDTDNDGINNAQDPDDDNDGVSDLVEIAQGSSPFNVDTNGDGIWDVGNGMDSDADGLVDDIDPSLDLDTTKAVLTDFDGDGWIDTVDPDWDNDGIQNNIDTHPYDADNDGMNDLLDLDDDNDGIPDTLDVVDSSLTPNQLSRDTDNDGLPNALDPDDDGDGILDTAEWGYQLDGNQDGNRNGLGFTVYHGDRDGLSNATELPLGTDIRNTDSDGDGLRDNGTAITPLVPTADEDNDGIANAFDIFPRDSDNDGTGDATDPDDDNDGILDVDDANPYDSNNDGVLNALATDMDGDGLLNRIERMLGTSPYVNAEKDFLLPSQDRAQVNALPTWPTTATTISLDWSKVTGDTRDTQVPFLYAPRQYLLPSIPVWKLSTLIDDSDRPTDYQGPLWGQLELQHNFIPTGFEGECVIPLTDFLIQQKRKLLFKVFGLNERRQWVELTVNTRQDGRWLYVTTGPYRAFKVYYQDKGFTVSAGENNAGGGGCLLR